MKKFFNSILDFLVFVVIFCVAVFGIGIAIQIPFYGAIISVIFISFIIFAFVLIVLKIASKE